MSLQANTYHVFVRTFSKNLKSLVPLTVYDAAAPSIDRRIMFATSCCLFDNHKGICSIKDTNVSIKSREKEQMLIRLSNR